ncbi:MAG: cyclodeaminase/cyclohydrolase family protein [Solirubrobacteraceae bacterium]
MDENPLIGVAFGQLLDQLAENTPAPGAGTAAALTCSVAAALLEMTAAFDPTPTGTAATVRAGALRERSLELAERELHSYQPVLDALRMPNEDPNRADRLSGALAAASAAPLGIASVAAQLAGIAAECVDGVSDHLIGEAIVASELAEGACRAAGRLVQINLAGSPSDPRLTEVAGLLKAAAEARAETLAKVSGD